MSAPRYGVFGGAFDPPHNGHLAVAQEAVRQLQLDRLLLVVAARSPLKAPSRATAAQRLEMARLLAAMVDRADASDIELGRDGPSYTVDTLRALRASADDAEWWLIMGADQFADLARWRAPDELLAMANIAVFPRPGFAIDVPGVVESIEQATGICYDTHNNGQEWNCQRRDDHTAATRIRLLQMTPVSVSSTAIRTALAQGRPVEGLVPGPIAQWIEAHGIYARPAESATNSHPAHQRNT